MKSKETNFIFDILKLKKHLYTYIQQKHLKGHFKTQD